MYANLAFIKLIDYSITENQKLLLSSDKLFEDQVSAVYELENPTSLLLGDSKVENVTE